jgi:hypothetical protein
VPDKRLSKEWSPEEAAMETKDSDESLAEAPTLHRRRLSADRARGGAEHQAGYEKEEEEERPDQQRRVPPDPPRQTAPR